jgi:hypothetical protein
MKKSVFLNTYKFALTALTMTIAVACTNSHQSQKPTGTDSARAEGTTDGAGGNGINGKAYEAYIVDPQTLPAYRNIVGKKIEALSKEWNRPTLEKDPKAKEDLFFSFMWKTKKWYLAPISLKSLDKKVIGVEFSVERTEQLAVQTEKEIWIDSRAFEKMSEQEQARLLTHEYVMNLYLMRFSSLYDICMQVSPFTETNCDTREEVDKMFPFEAKRDLNNEDYTNIRAMTDLIMQDAPAKAIIDSFAVKNFDKRYFISMNPHNKTFSPAEIKPEDLVLALKSASYTQRLNGACTGLRTSEHRECIFEVKESEGPTLDITIKEAETQKVLRTLHINKINISSIFNGLNREIFMAGLSEEIPNIEGQTLGTLAIYLKKEEVNEKFKVVGIIVNQLIVTSSIKDSKKNGCYNKMALPLKTKEFFQDAIYMKNGVELSDLDIQTALEFNISTSCN